MSRLIRTNLEGTPDQIDFCLDRIVRGDFDPTPDAPWRGRDEVAEDARKEFNSTVEAAYKIVDIAVAQLYSDQSNESLIAEKRLMILRLRSLGNVIFKSLLKGKRRRNYVYEIAKHENGNPRMVDGKKVYEKILKTGSTIDHLDPALIRCWLDIQITVAKLRGLDENVTAADLQDSLMKSLNDAHNRSGIELVTVTQKSIRKTPAAAAKLIEQAEGIAAKSEEAPKRIMRMGGDKPQISNGEQDDR